MNFGEMPDGTKIKRHTISGGGLTANFLNYGAVLQDLRLEGHDAPLVLGFEEFAPYLTDSPFFGAMAGRCANRVRNGQFEIDGKVVQTDRNFLGKHMLHGGAKGAGKVVWHIEDVTDDAITLTLEQADGDMGFPGKLQTQVVFSCKSDGVLDVEITAETDAPTPCNFAHHSYFALDDSGTLDAHLLQVDANHFTVVNEEMIPTGESRDVAGTRFDFRHERPVMDEAFIDHNLCLTQSAQPIRRIGHLRSTKSGVTMVMRSTEPGLQVYDGFKLDVGPPGLEGRTYRANAGIALEPQNWPDAVNHSHFPNVVLRPGETYKQHSQFAFSKG